MRMTSMQHRCVHVLLAALFWFLPSAVYAQSVDQPPVEKPAGAPKIVFESLAHDFGTVKTQHAPDTQFCFYKSGHCPAADRKSQGRLRLHSRAGIRQ